MIKQQFNKYLQFENLEEGTKAQTTKRDAELDFTSCEAYLD